MTHPKLNMRYSIFIAFLLCFSSLRAQSEAVIGDVHNEIKYHEITAVGNNFILKHAYDPKMVPGVMDEALSETVRAELLSKDGSISAPILSTYDNKPVDNKFFVPFNEHLLALLFTKEDSAYRGHLLTLNPSDFSVSKELWKESYAGMLSSHEMEVPNASDVGSPFLHKRSGDFDYYIDHNGHMTLYFMTKKITVSPDLEVEVDRFHIDLGFAKNRTSYDLRSTNDGDSLFYVQLSDADTTFRILEFSIDWAKQAFRETGFNFSSTDKSDLVNQFDSLTTSTDSARVVLWVREGVVTETAESFEFELQYDYLLDGIDESEQYLWNLSSQSVHIVGGYNKNTGQFIFQNFLPEVKETEAGTLEELIENPFITTKLTETNQYSLYELELRQEVELKYGSYYKSVSSFIAFNKESGIYDRVFEGQKFSEIKVLETQHGPLILVSKSKGYFYSFLESGNWELQPLWKAPRKYRKFHLDFRTLHYEGNQLQFIMKRSEWEKRTYYTVNYQLAAVWLDLKP